MNFRSFVAGAMLAMCVMPMCAASDVAGYSRYEGANRQVMSEPNTGSRVVFLGNSITDFWIGNSPEFFSENDFIDRGISGQSTYEFLLRFREDVVNLQPAAVVIAGGTNDCANNLYPYNEERTFGNLKSMVEIAQANGIKVFLASVLPASRFGWNPGVTDAADRIANLNARIKSYAEAKQIPYIDYYSKMVYGSDRSLNPAYTNDGVHPTKAGYKVMEETVLPIIRQYVTLEDCAPAQVTLSGDALDGEDAVECTKVSRISFEAFARLKGDRKLIIKDSDGKNWTVADGSLSEGNDGAKVASDGVYCISFDFGNKKASLKKVNSLGLFYCIDNKTVADFTYTGSGEWEAAWKCHLTTADYGKDTRYRFVMDIEGDKQYWGPVNDGEDGEPNGAESYYDMKRVYPQNQWDNKWKLVTRYNGKNLKFTVTLRGKYTHRVRQTSELDETALSAESLRFKITGNKVECMTDTTIYDVSGQRVANASKNTTVTLPAGIYIARAEGMTHKFSVR